MEYGISTSCFYPMPLRQAAGHIAEWGVPACEVFVNTFSELTAEFTGELRRLFDQSGTRVVSVHPFTSGMEPLMFFSDYTTRASDSIELYKRFFEAAAALGAKYFVFHGDRKESRFDPRRGWERFAALDDTARSFGLRAAQENVSRCMSGRPDYIGGMRRYLRGDVCFVLDVKQCIRAGSSVPDMLRAMGSCIRHVHISDSDTLHDCLPVGKGDFDFHGFIDSLAAAGYGGALITELYHDNYSSLEELRGSLDTLKKRLGESV